MATIGIDGLVSGLDTTALIDQLMAVESGTQRLLKTKMSSAESMVSALQGLNSKVASLATAAAKAADPASWSAWKATSSAPSVTATASSSAQPGTLSFSVDAVATTQVSISGPFSSLSELLPDEPPVVTIQKADGSLVTVEPTTGSLADVTKALNDASDAGIKATVVRVSGGDNPTYRLQFTGTRTGTDGEFAVYAGTAAEVEAGTATRLDVDEVRAAGNAKVTLWAGSAHAVSFEQSSNTFAGLLSGVDVTVSQVTDPDEPVTVTVGRDDAALTKLAADVMSNVSVVLQDIASRTRSTTTTNPDGTTRVTGGMFSGDSAIRQLNEQLASAVGSPVGAFSPSDVGIVVNRDGTFTFDEAAFGAALAADPAKVQHMVTTIAGRVADLAKATSDSQTGSLTLKIQGHESLVKDYGSQIESWDRRLEVRRSSLERTYAALEVTLSNLQSQSSWLAGQLAGFPTSSS